MSKKAVMTEQLKASIRRGIGDSGADVSNFSVFEARFLSTEPLNKGGIFNKARASVSTLEKMAAKVNVEGGAIPLHTMHNSDVLPIGKVFDAKLKAIPNGETELIGQFYIDPTETELISKVENSTIDEVSVGVLAEKILCSECGFDYRGPDATIMNFLDCTCNNDHTIGENGVHTRLVGLESWRELSLVGTGAANKAKILSRSKHSMNEDNVQKLAANGMPSSMLCLNLSNKIDEIKESKTTQGANMTDMTMLLSKYEESISAVARKDIELTAAKTEITTMTATVEELKASIAAKDVEIAALEASKSTDIKAVEEKVAASEQKLTAAYDSLMPHVKAALVASGVAESELPTDITSMVAAISEKGLKLHQLVGSTAVSAGEKVDLTAKAKDPRKEAFKLS